MKFIQAAVIACAVLVAAPLQAQEYPNAPVHVICGFSPGSTADLSARIVGAKMGQILGQQFVVESRLGAASSTPRCTADSKAAAAAAAAVGVWRSSTGRRARRGGCCGPSIASSTGRCFGISCH